MRPGHPGNADSRHILPRALEGPAPPKPSAKQMHLTRKSTERAEWRPSAGSTLVCKVGTDYCMHPPLGGTPRVQGFLPCVGPGKYQVLLSKTLPNNNMQPVVQDCWSMQTPWASTAQQTQGKQVITHLDGGDQYKSQVHRFRLRRGRSPSRGPVANRSLDGVHISTNFGIHLWYLSAHVAHTALPEIHGIKSLARVSQDFMSRYTQKILTKGCK